MTANVSSNLFAICMQSIRRVCIIAKKIGLNPFGNAGRTTNNVHVQQLSTLIDASEKVSVSGLAGSSYAFLVAAIFEKKKKKFGSYPPMAVSIKNKLPSQRRVGCGGGGWGGG